MERRLVKLFLALALTQVAPPAHAQLSDLPNPFEDGTVTPSEQPKQSEVPDLVVTPEPKTTPTPVVATPTATPTPIPVIPVKKDRPSVIIYPKTTTPIKKTPSIQTVGEKLKLLPIREISRKTGGAWYVADLSAPSTLSYIKITGYSQFAYKIHEAFVVLSNGRRVSVREMNSSAKRVYGEVVRSESLIDLSDVVSIQVRLESYGGYSEVILETGSPDVFNLNLRQVEEEPVTPTTSVVGTGKCARGSNIEAAITPNETQMLRWGQRRNGYYSGTAEFNHADLQANVFARKMRALVTPGALAQATTQQLDTLANKYSQKANSFYFGTMENKTYDVLANAFYNALPASVDTSLRCSNQVGLQKILEMAAAYTNKGNSYYSGTIQYNTYVNISRKLYNMAPAKYKAEALLQRKNVRALELDMERFAQQQNGYYSGTIQYDAYGQMSYQAQILSESFYRSAVKGMSASQRAADARYYSQKSNGYYSGTQLYNHYVTMMHIAGY